MGDTVTGHSPVDIAPQKVIEFARAIIRLPSVTGKEEALGRYLGHALEGFGLQVELEEVAPDRYNVLATLAGERPELGLLFHSHMDTVPYGAMPDPVSGEVRGDHIWGRGSVDQKGGLAASVMALAAIAQSGARLHSSLGLALVVDEESEHRGSMALVEQGLHARQAVVTEPSNLRLVIGCKGTTPFRISVTGKAAHGARPWLGVNAVHRAMQVVTALEELEYPEQDIAGYGSVRGSLNLGVVEGGRAYNIVPDECMLWFDRRTVPGETQDAVLDAVQSILDRLAGADPPVTSSLSVARPDWDWDPIRSRGLWPAVTPSGAPIRDLAARHHKAIVGCPVEIYFTDGYNEMDFLINDLNIPTIQYGPGDSRLCHTDEESLSIPQLLDATRVYVGMALESALA
jgi:acetylornithine deacetylase/succinyl-diaminopimelate desuccinylase